MGHRVIHLHTEAPPKPAPGAACNGCGVCCAWQPCPLGMLVSGRRQGTCVALRWQPEARLYRCAMVSGPEAVWPAMPAMLRAPLMRLARRWIASGTGCDSSLAVHTG